MSEVLDRLAVGWSELTELLPGLLAAAVIMLAGYVLARQLRRWSDRTLVHLEFRRLADAGGLTEAAERVRIDPVRAIGSLVFWLTMLVAVLLASSALGLENVREMFGRMLSFIPTLISGTVIIILGMIIGEFLRALIVASAGGVEGVVTVAKLSKGAIVGIAFFMALQEGRGRDPTRPSPSPTTVSAVNPKTRPPLTTLATLRTETNFSCRPSVLPCVGAAAIVFP